MRKNQPTAAISVAATMGNGTNGGLTPMIAWSQPGALPPGFGRSRIARPCQTKLMPSVTTIEGRLRQWMSAPRPRVERDAADQRQRAEPGFISQPCRRNATDKADESADRQIQVGADNDEHLRHRGERDRNRQIEHQREAEIADRARIEPGDRGDNESERQGGKRRAQPTSRVPSARAQRRRDCRGAHVRRPPRTKSG